MSPPHAIGTGSPSRRWMEDAAGGGRANDERRTWADVPHRSALPPPLRSRPGPEPRMRRPHATIPPFERRRCAPDCRPKFSRQLHWMLHHDPDAFKHKLGDPDTPQQGDRARAAAGQ